jgi:hypothetical protein
MRHMPVVRVLLGRRGQNRTWSMGVKKNKKNRQKFS